MTQFWREGHWRTSSLGYTHWVEGHWVDRDLWERSGSDSGGIAFVMLRHFRADRGTAARYINPNATCPVCGVSVYYYQNEIGSRVYFDDVGPPWPKHPCTDNPSAIRRGSEVVQPSFRDVAEISRIGMWWDDREDDPIEEFRASFGHAPWTPYEVRRRLRGSGATLWVLDGISPDGDRSRRFVSTRSLPRSVTAGAVVFMRRKRLAFIDLRTMRPGETDVTHLRGAAAFIRELVGPETDA